MTIKTETHTTASEVTEVLTHEQRAATEPVLLRIKDVERLIGLRRGAIYARIRDGLFPPPCKIGKRASVWPQYEVTYLNRAIMAGRSDDRIKSLVKNLVEQRAQMAGGGE
jgi:prophage regulatory protein